MKIKKPFSIIAATIVVAAAGCASTAEKPAAETTAAESTDSGGAVTLAGAGRAVAVMTPTRGNEAHGEVVFLEREGIVEIHPNLAGLEPHSVHGFHVHEFGDCSAPDAASAGGHFNPEGVRHGAPYSDVHHAGDLGNVVANAEGAVSEVIRAEGISLGKGADSIVGRSVILHSRADDFESQPSGDAGGRIACGVIGLTPSMEMLGRR